MNLSVIIPCYNESDTIEDIVQAVIDVTGPDREIIIVDDCSTDGTRELLGTENRRPTGTSDISRKKHGERGRIENRICPQRQKIS